MIFGFIPRGRHLFAYDVVTTALAILIAFAMRFDINNIALTMGPYLPAALLPLLTYPPTYVAFGLYRREWRYASVREMFAIAAAVLVGTGVTIVVFLVLALADVPGTTGFPRSVFFIEALLNLALLGGGRFFLRASLDRRTDAESGAPAVLTLVYGAGVIGIRKFIYDIWGDTVNIASRLESHGAPGRVHVSQAVFQRLQGRFAFDARGAIELKGRGPLSTYYLVAPA